MSRDQATDSPEEAVLGAELVPVADTEVQRALQYIEETGVADMLEGLLAQTRRSNAGRPAP